MRHLLPAALGTLVIWGLTSAAGAQTGSHTHTFKPLPETTIDGIVERVDQAGSDACDACQSCSDCAGTHLVVGKGGKRIEVHLAPAWFLERSGFVFSPGDAVSVTGSRIAIGRHDGILACQVQRGDIVMKLRDEHGLPLWRRELTEQ